MKSLFVAIAMAAMAAPSLAQTPPASPAAGGLTLQQLQDQRWAQFSMLDTDKDGKISRAEWDAMAAMAPGQLTPAAWARFDTNKDGFITRDEVNALVTARFALMDTNHDNRVSPEEMQAAQAAAMRQMQSAAPSAAAAVPPASTAQPPK